MNHRTTANCLNSILAMAIVAAYLVSDSAHAVTATSRAQPPLRVVASITAPFVLPRTDPPAGFSVDLWDEVARRLDRDFTWQIAPDPAQVLTTVQRNDADVAIGAIAVTQEGEQIVDFSLPYFDSGLRIMVPARYEAGILSTLKSIPWIVIGRLLGVAIGIIFLLANVLWLIDRRRRREPGRGRAGREPGRDRGRQRGAGTASRRRPVTGPGSLTSRDADARQVDGPRTLGHSGDRAFLPRSRTCQARGSLTSHPRAPLDCPRARGVFCCQRPPRTPR